ncbi:hypothetical protein ACQ4PT_014774 [Festuca glaucescens]
MEIFLSAAFGELMTRPVIFFVKKYSKQPVKALEINLKRILLRAQVIINEAEGRHITNQGMLRQLTMLRDAMYQGFYALDTLSISSPAPPALQYASPDGKLHVWRRMEMELILDFLLHTPSCSSRLDRFDVLPIIGPGSSGKSTLVAHVCKDKKVRDHFTRIAFFRHGTSEMKLQMEIFIPAVFGELATRSMSFFINKYSKRAVQAMEINLERILPRAQVIVDEAEGRHNTNQGMLRQLSMLRDAMYQGIYVLDTLRYKAFEDDGAGDHKAVSHSWAVSKFSCAKRLCLSSSSSTETSQELQVEEALGDLRTMILDVSETVMFLTSYPRLHRQPYSMHLQMENCMFGRQMEMELVLNFLLHTPPCSSRLDRFEVLPIVAPGSCGKSTLVAHVCNDERVRDHFSKIAFFRHGTFRDEDIATLTDGYAQNRKLLIIFEVVGELNDDLWHRLRSLSRSCAASGSKIIITGRSDKITELGTTQTMTLKDLPHEAFWYFFKVMTFGSTDPGMHPRLAYLAMEISKTLKGCLVSANIVARVLRANFNIQHWCKILKLTSVSVVEKHPSVVGEHPHVRLNETKPKPIYLRRLGRASADLFISGQYQTCCSQEELPEITLQDVIYGGVKPQGSFKVLAWKSPLPPYRCYIFACEIQQLQTRVVKRRRSLNNSGH